MKRAKDTVERKPQDCPKTMRDLSAALARAGSAEEICDFLHGILTPQERARIALRWELVKLLHRGTSQRRVGEMLGISLCKITRGARELKNGPAGFSKIVEKATYV